MKNTRTILKMQKKRIVESTLFESCDFKIALESYIFVLQNENKINKTFLSNWKT